MKAGDEAEMYLSCSSCFGEGERFCGLCEKWHPCGCCDGSGKTKNPNYRQVVVPSDAELQRREGK